MTVALRRLLPRWEMIRVMSDEHAYGDAAAEFGLVLAFDSDSLAFRRGFEAGMLWQRTAAEQSFSCYLGSDNAEMAMRIAEARGVAWTAEPCGEDWLWLTVRPRTAALWHPIRSTGATLTG